MKSGVNARRRISGDRWTVVAISCAAFALYSACSLLRFARYKANSYDLVIFDQAVRSYSRGRAPVAIVKGVHNGFGADFSVLGDHWSPVLALLAPLYWVHDGPRTLLVAQAALLALAVVPLWSFARRELGRTSAYVVVAGYAISWPVAEALMFDFHEVAFAPVLTAVLFERWSAYRHEVAPWWQTLPPVLALVLVKEDMGLLVAGFGMALVLGEARKSPRDRVALGLGAAFCFGGLTATLVAARVLIPMFGGDSEYYWAYQNFGPTLSSAAWHAVTHPLDVLQTFVQPGTKARTLFWLLVVAAFLPLASPYALTVFPLLATRMLSDGTFPAWWGTDYHYNAFLVVPLFCAGVDGAARSRRRKARRDEPAGSGERIWPTAVILSGLVSVPVFAFGPLLSGQYAEPSWGSAANAAVATVPENALVEASSETGPHLSGRAQVLLWDRTPRWAPWVVANVRSRSFPFCGLAEQKERVDFLLKSGYRTVFARDGFLVLHRPGPAPSLPRTADPSCR
ncbi:DUF2079 domain-containing protein [Spirillospora sp. CA-294931]|uniref:DUF2079 domain-containing protein n=1 Tax=Spirillospora sp. CA-294931 TaxID=3240042 RepID=UPI003D8F8314